MTSILKVLTEYCEKYVDDIRLQELLQTDTPLYARKMWGYFSAAIPLFNIPAEMQDYLLGTAEKPRLTEPVFADKRYIVSETQTSDFTISLGDQYKGFELFSCRILSTDSVGNLIEVPTEIASYDSETGEVTIVATTEYPVQEGTILDFDFYTDGYFTETLTPAIMNILGMCFQVVWLNRFATDWLSLVSKIEDKSFYEQNRANKENADTSRLVFARQQLAGEMRRFEQNTYYKNTIPVTQRIKL